MVEQPKLMKVDIDEELRLPLWHGNTKKDNISIHQWLEIVEASRDSFKWSDGITIIHVLDALGGNAQNWFLNQVSNGVDSTKWITVKTAFLKAFGDLSHSSMVVESLSPKSEDLLKQEWIMQGKNEDKEENVFCSVWEIFLNYTEDSTIQGLMYIFLPYQTIIGKGFWSFTLMLMGSLGLYWCADAYQNWTDQPFLTIIKTAGLPVEQVDFPAVTIFGYGRTHSNIEPAFYKLFENFLESRNMSIPFTSLELSVVLRNYTSQRSFISREKLIDSLENFENNESRRSFPSADIAKVKNLIAGSLYAEFLNTNFPGIVPHDDILSILKLMSSESPMSEVAANIALEGGYNPCDKFSGNESFWLKNVGCPPGFIPDTTNEYCYKVLPNLETLSDGQYKCEYENGAEIITFLSNYEVLSLIFLLKMGKLDRFQDSFYVMAKKDIFGWFNFENIRINLPTVNFHNINFQQYLIRSNIQCLTGKFNSSTLKLDLFETDCTEKHTIICRKIFFVSPNCNKTLQESLKNSTPFEIMFNPVLRKQYHLAIAYRKAEMTEIMNRLNRSAAYQSIFQTLWYSSLPCFDIRNKTAFSNGASALLQYCEWKGIPISCSAIFTTFPTDQGMCCSFNMKAADEIYVENTFRNMLLSMQKLDKQEAFLSSTVPTYYAKNGEPKTIPGRNKGLILMLDSHSDWLAPGSNNGYFGGFKAFIESSESFPLMSHGGIQIKPGYNNIITLTSTLLRADESMRSLDKKDRNCLFPEENDDLNLHKKYTYLNCKFECTLNYTQSVIAFKYNKTCQPWFFPISSDTISMCDPWQSSEFFQIMRNEIPDDMCKKCLPDCSVTIYNAKIFVEPFDKCSANNIGAGLFCKITFEKAMQMQMRLASQIQNESFNASTGAFEKQPNYLTSIKSSIRSYGYDAFKKPKKTYDAIDEDIAMVQIIYQKSTAIQMGSRLTMTWVDYFSAVGGLLGLVLGMGFVTFIEIFWLGMRILGYTLNWPK